MKSFSTPLVAFVVLISGAVTAAAPAHADEESPWVASGGDAFNIISQRLGTQPARYRVCTISRVGKAELAKFSVAGDGGDVVDAQVIVGGCAELIVGTDMKDNRLTVTCRYLDGKPCETGDSVLGTIRRFARKP